MKLLFNIVNNCFIFLTGAYIQETALSLIEPVDSGLFLNNLRTVRTLKTIRDGLNAFSL